MTRLVHQRCLNHADREAAARCPECQRFFCRECVSEHETRILCAACLSQIGSSEKPSSSRLSFLLEIFQAALACAVIWFIFYLIGLTLLAIPTSFHDGSIWKSANFDTP